MASWNELNADVLRLQKERNTIDTQQKASVEHGYGNVYDYSRIYAMDCKIDRAFFWRDNMTLSESEKLYQYRSEVLAYYTNSLRLLEACTTWEDANKKEHWLKQLVVWFRTLDESRSAHTPAFPENPGDIIDSAFAKKKAELQSFTRASITSTLGRVVGLCDF
jgi:hypothetical protein